MIIANVVGGTRQTITALGDDKCVPRSKLAFPIARAFGIKAVLRREDE